MTVEACLVSLECNYRWFMFSLSKWWYGWLEVEHLNWSMSCPVIVI
jgi:hypothetical protein